MQEAYTRIIRLLAGWTVFQKHKTKTFILLRWYWSRFAKIRQRCRPRQQTLPVSNLVFLRLQNTVLALNCQFQCLQAAPKYHERLTRRRPVARDREKSTSSCRPLGLLFHRHPSVQGPASKDAYGAGRRHPRFPR